MARCGACGQPPAWGWAVGNAARFPRAVPRIGRSAKAGIGAADCPKIHSAWVRPPLLRLGQGPRSTPSSGVCQSRDWCGRRQLSQSKHSTRLFFCLMPLAAGRRETHSCLTVHHRRSTKRWSWHRLRAVPTDPDGVDLQDVSEFCAGELATLVGVEDFRGAVAGEGFLKRRRAEIRRQRVGQPPGQYPPGRPVENGDPVPEALLHRDVGDVGSPHLVRPVDDEAAQQGGVDLVLRVGPARVGPRGDRPKSPFLPQSPDTSPTSMPSRANATCCRRLP